MPLLEYPRTLQAPPRGRVLVLAPHADDETIGCGGAIALHVAQGDPVSIAIATDGALGEPGGRFAGQDYRELRRREARAAAAVLGAAPPDFWEYPDQGLAGLLREQPSPLVARIDVSLERLRPAVVYHPADDEVHPDHHALAAAVAAALERQAAGRRPLALAYEVWVPVHATRVIDVTAVWPVKQRALEQYSSQLAYSDYLHAVRGLNAARSIYLPGARYVEAFAGG